MILHLHRDIFNSTSTLGTLSVDGKPGFFTCEDIPRETKIAGVTCIPLGRYRVKTTYSPKYKRMMPLVCDVPGFQGIRIHSGNTSQDTEGCILIGTQRDVVTGTISHSRAACKWMYNEIARVEALADEVWIEITTEISS